ncbi:acyl-CoA synthetase [Rubellimicrobium sp. CFH 75288]|uniref:acyl-CoA synthetase n=1 Tax=Rubellimicrobium sp. CFH 75288 TaxID=2697034 RepID=UPI001411BC69|nr:acyl-CoA synthetase [Rubellimicrobium sp. CFH 75288]NAZ35317.1 acyl-CoA synthetase [Rubellimicrobium sp. CFH 75288]
MGFAGLADAAAIEAEGPWDERDLPRTMWSMLSRTAARVPDRPAVTFQMFSDPKAPAETLNWAELQGRVAQAANLFRSLGIGETDTIAYLLPNCTEVVLTYLGGQIAGIVNPINPLLDAEQIAGILRESRAKALVTLKAFPRTDVAQKAAAAAALAPDLRVILEVDLLRYLTGVKKLIVPLIRPKNPFVHKARVLDFNAELSRQPRTLSFQDSAGDRVAAQFHTGGTTGLPKLAQHRYRGLVYNGWVANRLLFTERDTMICPLPMFHVFAAVVCMGASVASGAHIVFPTPQGYRGEGVMDNFWKLVERHRVTFVITVPTAISALMQRPVNADISSLQLAFSGSAPLPVELFNRFEKAAGLTIIEGYGLTEATCLVSVNPPDGERKVGSVGLPFPYTKVRIIDPATQRDCPPDEIGEICVSNPGVWGGHTYTEAEKNRDLFYPGPDGEPTWLRTGDLGRLDPDGYLWITGRAKDIIIRGGHNIDPAEIEEAMVRHPAVALAGAIGQPDAHAGEVPCVYVELVQGASVTPEELLDHARAHVHERAAHPKHAEILPELPKTAVGKIFKPDLRKLAIRRIYNEALAAAGVQAEVAEVVEDRRLGLVARLRRAGQATDEDVQRALGAFTRPWTWAD